MCCGLSLRSCCYTIFTQLHTDFMKTPILSAIALALFCAAQVRAAELRSPQIAGSGKGSHGLSSSFQRPRRDRAHAAVTNVETERVTLYLPQCQHSGLRSC